MSLTTTRRSKWTSHGARTLEESARQKLHDILSAEPVRHLDAHQEAELRRIEESGLRSLTGS